MSPVIRETRTGRALAGAAVVMTALALAPVSASAQATATQKAQAAAHETKQETKEAAHKTGNVITDSWITMKVHSQFVPENVLEKSDIDVDTKAGVVTLMGTVPTGAGKTRAVAIAKATDGVKSVNDRLRVVPEAEHGASATANKAGNTISDGWVTSKIYADYIDEDVLEGSDIDVDVDAGVATLKGTVPTQAGSARAAAIAKATDGVKSVRNNLKVVAKTPKT
ncbi:Osmotically-inducible protein Y precursor [Luteitalea pratensis]|uniref:Osmotically-inducible protein Y n=1 Tax=Luteitalea pratensis TaxID=1855912 RepID=A0A143PKF0_LUTPR|nr:BON domain-containing protein [Luteitalea pratensis]AMY08733.1 Osmotically-inducible protein Y precursor [Luteitalea pratensis]